jgi:hypothetical protein
VAATNSHERPPAAAGAFPIRVGAVLERPGPADFARWLLRHWHDYAVSIAAVLILLAVAALAVQHAVYQREQLAYIERLARSNRAILDAIAAKLEIK